MRVIQSFCRMYLAHISRENSVAFRTFQAMIPHARYQDLGEQFEDKEHALFGQDGFEKTLDRVIVIEKDLQINNLDQFTDIHTNI